MATGRSSSVTAQVDGAVTRAVEGLASRMGGGVVGRWRRVMVMLGARGGVSRVRRTPYGLEMQVVLRDRHAASTLLQSRETVAGIFRVARIDAQPHPGDASRATL